MSKNAVKKKSPPARKISKPNSTQLNSLKPALTAINSHKTILVVPLTIKNPPLHFRALWLQFANHRFYQVVVSVARAVLGRVMAYLNFDGHQLDFNRFRPAPAERPIYLKLYLAISIGCLITLCVLQKKLTGTVIKRPKTVGVQCVR